MTHTEIQELVAAYALDALNAAEETIVADHLTTCPDCAAEYVQLLTTVDELAEGPSPSEAPPALRSRVLASAEALFAEQATPPPPLPFRAPTRGGVSRVMQVRRFEWLAAAAVICALSVSTFTSVTTNRQSQAQLTRDGAALGLLTSTETTNDMLVRGTLANVPAEAHGHWFHRASVMTQVVVGEFLPPAPAGQHYTVWLRRSSGWATAGEFQVDAAGYGRVIVLGSDGSDVQAVEITLEQGQPDQPSSRVALRFPAS